MNRTVNCKDCNETIQFTAKRGQKSKTLTCNKGHKHSYSLASAKRSLSLPSIKISKPRLDTNVWTILIVIAGFIIGLVIGRLTLPFLGWVFQMQPWYWITVLWVLAWGCLVGWIAYRTRIK